MEKPFKSKEETLFHPLTKKMTDCCEDTADAALNNHLDCLKRIYSESEQWHPETIWCSAYSNSLEILKYAYSHGCPWHEDTIYVAAKYGHFEILKYAHSHGCPCNPGTTGYFACYGHLDCLKYLREKCGYEWDSVSTCYAAFHNHLDCLLYCLENDCPIHPETLDKLYINSDQIDDNLLTNINFRKILLHPRLKNEINIDKYPKFVNDIEKYTDFINKFYTLLEFKANIPTDVIKYEIMNTSVN